MDLIEDPQASMTFHAHPGGSVSNVAGNVAQFQKNSALLACVGEDAFGTLLMEKLEKRGVVKDYLQRSKKSTSLVLVNQSQGTPTPYFYRMADVDLREEAALDALLDQIKVLHFSFWPLTHDASRKVVMGLLKKAKAKGICIGFDPNYHEALWKQEEPVMEMLATILEYVDVIKPSLDDASRLLGEHSMEYYLDAFQAFGIQTVILTLGKEGLVARHHNQRVQLPSMAQEVVDTTGAGDAFWGGYYAALLENYDWISCLKAGSMASAFKLKTIGSDVHYPSVAVLLGKEAHDESQ